jgi:hypothetical protein
MKALTLGMTLALAGGIGLSAQTTRVKQDTKIEVKDGKDVTVTGCVEPAESGTGYVLTNVESRHGDPTMTYALVGEDGNVSPHVGHLVEIKGKATNIGDDGKVEITTKTKVEREHADDEHSKQKTEIKGATDLPYLGVKSVKMLRGSCS